MQSKLRLCMYMYNCIGSCELYVGGSMAAAHCADDRLTAPDVPTSEPISR